MDVTAQPQVECDAAHVHCSPVQCVPRDRICDGRVDCRNGRDEYCLRLNQVDAPREGDTCFRCGDGTCVLPKAPRYSEQWEIPLWFLCDGVKHCLDGWDERKDVCYRRQGRVSAVFECVPNDLPPDVNMSALLWTVLRCDGRQDCRDGVDETGCKNSAAGLSEQLHFDPLTACLIAALLITVCGGFVFITRRVRQRASQVTKETCGDDHSDCLAGSKRRSSVVKVTGHR
ncbi:low-density lipoprotein receptor-like [Pomacea canaliculata]|uniref:low-density lipoprotein receptor-like n=1 Tax=Pomacea canaliculata TaxID=400727 RepID=UPI000D72F4A5|nr:low-density lipoprotein receptor-like [Pomacea canaliculata]